MHLQLIFFLFMIPRNKFKFDFVRTSCRKIPFAFYGHRPLLLSLIQKNSLPSHRDHKSIFLAWRAFLAVFFTIRNWEMIQFKLLLKSPFTFLIGFCNLTQQAPIAWTNKYEYEMSWAHLFLGAHSAFGEMYDNKLACEKLNCIKNS